MKNNYEKCSPTERHRRRLLTQLRALPLHNAKEFLAHHGFSAFGTEVLAAFCPGRRKVTRLSDRKVIVKKVRMKSPGGKRAKPVRKLSGNFAGTAHDRRKASRRLLTQYRQTSAAGPTAGPTA